MFSKYDNLSIPQISILASKAYIKRAERKSVKRIQISLAVHYDAVYFLKQTDNMVGVFQ